MATIIEGIPQHMIHERDEWEGEYPVAGWVYDGTVYVAPRINTATIDGNAIHWPGSTSATIDTSTDEKMIARLRSTQAFYARFRGYSNGYGFDVDQRGHVWVVRGFDLKCAANSRHNDHVIAVKMTVGAEQEPTAAQIESVRKIIRQSARNCGREPTPWSQSSGWWTSGHDALRQYPPRVGQGTITACCGEAIYRHLDTGPVGDGGDFHPRNLTDNPPTPEPEDTDMLTIRIDGYQDQFMAVPIANIEALNKMGLADQPPVVVSADPDEVEAHLPYDLTPMR